MSDLAIDRKLEYIENLLKKVQLPWEGYSNIPFYVEVKKPRPSMSKHDSRPTYWDYDDGEYLYACVNWMPDILKYIEDLKKEANDA